MRFWSRQLALPMTALAAVVALQPSPGRAAPFAPPPAELPAASFAASPPAAPAPALAGAQALTAAGSSSAAATLGLQLEGLAGGGLLVGGVVADSPAAAAGLARGDILVLAAGHPLLDLGSLRSALEATPIGGTLRLGVIRSAQLVQVAVPRRQQPAGLPTPPFLDEMPVDVRARPVAASTSPAAQLGLTCFDAPWGVTVQSVRPASPAGRAGFRAGDLILQAGRAPLASLASLERWLQQSGGGELRLKILRGGRSSWRSLATGVE